VRASAGFQPLFAASAGIIARRFSMLGRQDRAFRLSAEAPPLDPQRPHRPARAKGTRGIAIDAGGTTPRRALFEKIWSHHSVKEREDGETLLYVDRHLMHEGAADALEALRRRGLKPRAPDRTFAVPDHYVPTDTCRWRRSRTRAAAASRRRSRATARSTASATSAR
jgi:Aconitase family (aconitate hydratase)